MAVIQATSYMKIDGVDSEEEGEKVKGQFALAQAPEITASIPVSWDEGKGHGVSGESTLSIGPVILEQRDAKSAKVIDICSKLWKQKGGSSAPFKEVVITTTTEAGAGKAMQKITLKNAWVNNLECMDNSCIISFAYEEIKVDENNHITSLNYLQKKVS